MPEGGVYEGFSDSVRTTFERLAAVDPVTAGAIAAELQKIRPEYAEGRFGTAAIDPDAGRRRSVPEWAALIRSRYDAEQVRSSGPGVLDTHLTLLALMHLDESLAASMSEAGVVGALRSEAMLVPRGPSDSMDPDPATLEPQVDHVFICYSRHDAAVVREITTELKARGVSIWIDTEDIPPGANWDRSIDRALQATPCLMVFLSRSSVASDEVQGEWSLALDEEKAVIPVLIEECEVPRRLRARQHIELLGRPLDTGRLDRLATTLKQRYGRKQAADRDRHAPLAAPAVGQKGDEIEAEITAFAEDAAPSGEKIAASTAAPTVESSPGPPSDSAATAEPQPARPVAPADHPADMPVIEVSREQLTGPVTEPVPADAEATPRPEPQPAPARSGSPAPPPRPPLGRGTWTKIGAGAAAVVAVIIGVVVISGGGDGDTPPATVLGTTVGGTTGVEDSTPVTQVTAAAPGAAVAVRVSAPPAIDGDSADWPRRVEHATPALVYLHPQVENGSVARLGTDAAAQVLIGWDTTDLYVFASVRDDIVSQPNRGNQIWRGDAITINLSVGGAGASASESPDGNDFQLTLSPGDPAAGTVPESVVFSGVNGQFGADRTGVAVVSSQFPGTEIAYQLEARVPWQVFGVGDPTASGGYGALVAVFDNDGEFEADGSDPLQAVILGNTANARFQGPSTWGTLTLER